MPAPRNIMAVNTGRLLLRDLKNNAEDDSPATKKPKSEKFPLNRCQFAAVIAIFFLFATGLLYLPHHARLRVWLHQAPLHPFQSLSPQVN
ncbi:hypothetical protein Ahy_B06g081940 [Arachis hypogaea]|uniref:Uncharacterized protein n=1 Tax=Arachis hypogaea TaxID=3818 RepID=A0A444YMG2_ARAHY|nr:hypothetical protein Ahy_B06g081940 [Arachis hypogaea]